MIHFVEKSDCGGARTDPVRWFPNGDAAEQWILENPPDQYDTLFLYALAEDGTVNSVGQYAHHSETYTGPLVRARINLPDPRRYAHRVPIECWTPSWPHVRMTEDHPLRIVANSCCGTAYDHKTDEFFHCHCGDWVEIEGSPEKIAEYVAEHGAA